MSIQKLFDYSMPQVAAATVLGLSAIVVGIVGAYTAYSIKLAGGTIEVTGSAKQSVEADSARWVLNLETRTNLTNQQQGYARLAEATKKVTTYLDSQGFKNYETPAANSFQNYSYPQYGEPILTGFTVSRQIIVLSTDIDKISKLANSVEPFVGADYTVTTQSLELTYSKLDEMRVSLLSKAIADARARAEAIAGESSKTVGSLKTATGGVVQVLPKGGIEISDYGSYDTTSVNKDIMVTVRATFQL